MSRTKQNVYTMKLIVSCEHGGNTIPEHYIKYFKDAKPVLKTHRGFDLGALDLFYSLKPLSDYSIFSETSRLLIELNRSLHHKNLFSILSKVIPEKEKEHLINGYYSNYRNAVESKIKSYIEANETVLHISVHTFTPVLNTKERHCDVGLLYNSANKEEQLFCKNFKAQIKKYEPDLVTRFNYPYLGKADGFTTYLRNQFKRNYLGIEIEVNQKYSKNNIMDQTIKNCIYKALKDISTKPKS